MKIYNSITRKKEEFIPIDPNEIKMYVCGQTVYDYCHLGHARKAIVFDMIRRWFMASNYKVTFVENITDIDDKIINRAYENNESITLLTSRFIQYMHEDFAALGVLPPDIQPKATEYIPQMLDIIQTLIDKGFAYVAANGDIFYAVRKFASYGKLSGKSLDLLMPGERVEVDNNKRDPLDFVLWKMAKENEPYWDSPFGKGRPGWHIECSAMSQDILGSTFDIHGGGEDLQFPHHENEIAQSEACNDCKFARYWMHNGFLNINDEKMSKSLGNFFTLRDVLKTYSGETIRFFMLKTHYRSPLNFNQQNLNEAKNGLDRLYNCINNVSLNATAEPIDWNETYAQKIKLAMEDDFNTSLALSYLFEMCNKVNSLKDIFLANQLVKLANVFGLLSNDPQQHFKRELAIAEEEINKLIEQRATAKINKNYSLADEIRKKLLEQNIVLEDTASGTKWKKI
ncbi:MAG: cysteine--tRNA ligase [Burkholderiales bacterium]|nr:cysteine--tRNA ligase [Burkholderiales bacterium]